MSELQSILRVFFCPAKRPLILSITDSTFSFVIPILTPKIGVSGYIDPIHEIKCYNGENGELNNDAIFLHLVDSQSSKGPNEITFSHPFLQSECQHIFKCIVIIVYHTTNKVFEGNIRKALFFAPF